MTILRSHSLPEASTSDASLTLLTLREAAHELRCSKTLLFKVRQGQIHGLPPLPVFHIGRKAFIRHSQLQAWVRTLEDIERENAYSSGNFGLRDDEWETIAGA